MAKRAAGRLGLEIARHHPAGARRADLLRVHDIELVLDVGANRGQYATELRAHGYAGRIVSFEPAAEPFATLARRAARDAGWDVHRLAASDREAALDLGAADNFSSVLPASDRLTELFAQAAPRTRQRIQAVRLDAAQLVLPPGRRTLLKLDVQGYERQALEGAAGIMSGIALVEAELSLRALYVGQALMSEIVTWLDGLGFELCDLSPVLRDPRTGEYLQFDGLFRRR